MSKKKKISVKKILKIHKRLIENSKSKNELEENFLNFKRMWTMEIFPLVDGTKKLGTLVLEIKKIYELYNDKLIND